MQVKYKDYELTIKKGKVVCVSLDGEDIGMDFESYEAQPRNLDDAIEWIEEDIQCRIDEEGENKSYVPEKAEIYVHGGEGTLAKDGTVRFVRWSDEADMFYDGVEVLFDDDGKAYTE
ncbi:MAG: hypothetical protein J7L15_08290 [Clostridiales bacterium]|nr:hypothetical protein [Clostridiales bacterium]